MFQQNFTSLICFLTGGKGVVGWVVSCFVALFDFINHQALCPQIVNEC